MSGTQAGDDETKVTSGKQVRILKTPLHPHPLHIGKLVFTGKNIIFLIFALKHRLWVLLRTA